MTPAFEQMLQAAMRRSMTRPRRLTLETPEGANLVSITLDGEEWRVAIVDEQGRTSRREPQQVAAC